MIKRYWLLPALLCATLAGCAGSSLVRPQAPQGGDPPASELPGLASLDSLRGVSAASFGDFIVADSHSADLSGGGVTLQGSPGNHAWVLLDLGVLSKDAQPTSIGFPDAPDWSTLTPVGSAWLGLADYSSGRWRFIEVDSSNQSGVDLTGLSADFASPAGHAYAAVLSDHPSLQLGLSLALESEGLLANIHAVTAEVDELFSGRYSSVAISEDGVVSLVSLAATGAGGILARSPIGLPGVEFDWELTDLSQVGGELVDLTHYQPGYNSDGELVIIAANTISTRTLRYVTEDGAETAEFSAETAVDSGELPLEFTNPQFSYVLDETDQPHIAFIGDDAALTYTFRFVGSWFQSSGGPESALFPSIALDGEDVYVCYQDASSANARLAIATHPQAEPLEPWDASHDISPSAWRDAGQFTQLLRNADSELLHVVHCAQPSLSADLDLNYAQHGPGSLSSGWVNQTADNGDSVLSEPGSESRETGFGCRMTLTADGRPVIASYDEDGRLLLSVASGSGGGSGDDLGWARLVVDADFGDEPGRELGIDSWRDAGSNAPDIIVVSYEKRDTQDGSSLWVASARLLP